MNDVTTGGQSRATLRRAAATALLVASVCIGAGAVGAGTAGITAKQRALRSHADTTGRAEALDAAPLAVCGDALLDAGETCDDGNTNPGDGCSALCQVEPGFECTDPIAPGGNVVVDGSFEAGTPNPSWAEYSLQFGTPLCDPATCFQNGASDGRWWAWFGGIDAFEQASLEQVVTIPSTATTLSFDVRVGECDSGDDFLSVQIDGAEVRNDPCALTAGYVTRSVPVDDFADGGAHTLSFEATTFATNGGNSNIFVDRVAINDESGEPVPSQCTPLPPLCQGFDFDTESGDLSGWVLFHTTSLPVDWGTTDDGFCWSNTPDQVPAVNVTGGSGEAACADSDAAGLGAVDMYLCSPLLEAAAAVGAELRFRYNYQLFGAAGPDDRFEVLVGSEPPDAQSVGGYFTVFSTNENHGGLIALPGDSEQIDLSSENVYACFRYGGNFDWYAQLDDVELRAASCSSDADADGIPDDEDNCTLVANASQRDTDADGFGNDCDGDFDQNCAVNFTDLGTMKANFFQPGTTHTDMNGDGQTNFTDLGLLKGDFFQPPGPSGIPNICSTR
jgi:cysteine-rich repeat protein